MEREILLGITGTQWEMLDDGGQGPKDAEAVEMLTSADYFFKNGKHYFVYEEASESGRKSGKSKIKITGDRSVEIMKAGEMRGSLFLRKISALFPAMRRRTDNFILECGRRELIWM